MILLVLCEAPYDTCGCSSKDCTPEDNFLVLVNLNGLHEDTCKKFALIFDLLVTLEVKKSLNVVKHV